MNRTIRTTAEAKALFKGNFRFPRLGDLRTQGDLQWFLQDYKKKCLENDQHVIDYNELHADKEKLYEFSKNLLKQNEKIKVCFSKNKKTLEFVLPRMKMLEKRVMVSVDNNQKLKKENQKLKKTVRRLEDKFEVDVGDEDSVIDDDDVITDEDGNFTGFIDGINILPLPPNENRKNRGETKRNH